MQAYGSIIVVWYPSISRVLDTHVCRAIEIYEIYSQHVQGATAGIYCYRHYKPSHGFFLDCLLLGGKHSHVDLSDTLPIKEHQRTNRCRLGYKDLVQEQRLRLMMWTIEDKGHRPFIQGQS